MRRNDWLGLALCALAVLAACGQPWTIFPPQEQQNPPQSHGGPVRDHISFVDNLRALGYLVEPSGEVQQPFLRTKGTTLRISGPDLSGVAEVQSFNYDDRDLGTDGVAAARADASQILPTGQPRAASVMWLGPPHFFRKERLLVIYVGSDLTLLKRLSDLLGPQFAGG